MPTVGLAAIHPPGFCWDWKSSLGLRDTEHKGGRAAGSYPHLLFGSANATPCPVQEQMLLKDRDKRPCWREVVAV